MAVLKSADCALRGDILTGRLSYQYAFIVCRSPTENPESCRAKRKLGGRKSASLTSLYPLPRNWTMAQAD